MHLKRPGRKLLLASSVFLILSSLTLTSTARAASSEFYCRPDPDQKDSPVVFSTSVKGCNNRDVEKKDVCMQKVQCAFLEPKARKALAATLADLTKAGIPRNVAESRKEAFLKTMGLEWLPTTVTCAALGVQTNFGSICPMPNDCKGDLFYNPKEAVSDVTGLINRINKNGAAEMDRPFKHETDSKTTGAKQ